MYFLELPWLVRAKVMANNLNGPTLIDKPLQLLLHAVNHTL